MVTRISAGLPLAFFLAFTSGCTPGAQRGDDEVPPELTFQNLAFRVYRGPVLEAQGTAAAASFRRDNGDASGRIVAVRLPPVPGRDEVRVRAAQVDGNVRGRRFVASGGVHAEEQRQVADTARARYDGADGLVRGDDPVTVRGGGFVARGAGFTLDPHEGRLRLVGGTRVIAGGARP
jgi:Lipopolysaccharide-assembly, LptC-related